MTGTVHGHSCEDAKKKVKKDNKSKKWNAQQKENFECFGDISQGVPYKSYRNVDIPPPVANIPLQQPVNQPPAAQQPMALAAPIAATPAQPLVILLAPVAATAAAPLLILLIVITPPPRPITPSGQKRPQLQTIPEEDKDDPPEPQRARFQCSSSFSSSSSSSDNFDTPPDTPAARPGGQGVRKFGCEDLPSAFGRLALTPDSDLPARKVKIPIDSRGEGATKIPGASKPLQHFLAKAGPPSQRT